MFLYKKKIVKILCVLLFILCLTFIFIYSQPLSDYSKDNLAFAVGSQTPSGDGTANSPFLLENAGNLSWFKTQIGNNLGNNQNTYYKLTANIDCSSLQNFAISSFGANFFGNNYTLYNIELSSADANLGLFSSISSGGLVKDLGLVDLTISSTSGTIGGITGQNNGTIENCFVTGSLFGQSKIGGIAAINSGAITKSSFNGKIHGTTLIGGLVGDNQSQAVLSSSYSYATIDSTATSYIGAAVGNNAQGATLSNIFYCNTKTKFFGVGADNSLGADNGNVKGLELYQITGANAFINMPKLYEDYSVVANTPGFLHLPYQKTFAINSYLIDTLKPFDINLFTSNIGSDSGLSEDNPFLVESIEQLNNLSYAVSQKISFQGYYFTLTASLNFEGKSFQPIGNKSLDAPFRGTFNGNENTISSLKIETLDQDYVGLFGYIAGGALKNLNIQDTCSFIGNKYIGSFVGYGANSSLSCLSNYGSVTANDYAGGIVGYGDSLSLSSIINCKAPTARSYARGIMGDFKNSGAVTKTVYLNLDPSYKNNDIGTVLNLESLEDGTLSRDSSTISFKAEAKDSYSVELRDENETVVYSGETSTIDQNTKLLFLRYTFSLTYHISTDKIIIQNKDTVKYYIGQNVRINISLKDKGYYISKISLGDGVTFSLSNDGTAILVSFTMTSAITSLTVETTDIVADNVATIYAKEAIEYSGITLDSNYSYAVQYPLKTPPITVGVYTVTISIIRNEIKLGSIDRTITINTLPVTFSVNPSIHFVKEFDNNSSAYSVKTGINPINITNLCKNDDVAISATIIFETQTIGKSKSGTANYVLSGKDSKNYSISTSEQFTEGEITKRTLEVSINAIDLSVEYTDTPTKPTYAATKLYGYSNVDVIFTLTNLDPSAIDATNTKNVGRYSLSVSLAAFNGGDDTAIYNVVLANPDYVMAVTPKPVTVTYTNYENLIYNGSSFAVNGTYNDIHSSTKTVYFTYYQVIDGSVGTEAITPLNASNYRALPTIDPNYAIIGNEVSGEKFIDFSIAKAEQGTLQFDSFDQKTYGDAAFSPTLTNNGSGSGALTLTTVEGADLFSYVLNNEVFTLTILGAGDIGLKITRATSQNYLEKTSDIFSFSILKYQIKLGLEDLTIKYSEPMNFVYTYETLVNGDTVPFAFKAPSLQIDIGGSYVNLVPTLAYNANTDGYDIKMIEDATSRDYSFTYQAESSKLVVEKVLVTITILPSSHIYGNIDSAINFKSKTENGEDILHGANCHDGQCAFVNALVRDNQSMYNVGTYAVLTEQFNIANSLNSEISFINQGNLYSITKRNITITATSKNKNYLEADPTPEFTHNTSDLAYADAIADVVKGTLSRLAGEEASFDGVANYISYEYYSNTLTISGNYTLIFVKGSLLIHRINPVVTTEGKITVQYGDKLKVVKPSYETALGGTFTWNEEEVLPVNGGTYKGVFSPTNKSYYTKSLTYTTDIIKRQITVSFAFAENIYYTGVEQSPIAYTFNNVLAGDELSDSLVYDRIVKLVGTYTATIHFSNDNYTIISDDNMAFIVNKAPLSIKVEDMDINQGQTPVAKFIYVGFVNNENIEVLLTPPTVILSTAPGNHKVMPSGASADNYQITYIESNLYIKRTNLTSEGSVVSIDGRFDNDMILTVEEIKKGTNTTSYQTIVDKFEEFKATQTGNLAKSKVQKLYAFHFSINNSDTELSQRVKVKLELPTKLREAKYHNVFVVDKNGNMKLVENCVREGNYLVFETDTFDYIGIVNPPNYTYLILSIALGAAFILILSLDALSEKLGIKKKKAAKKIQPPANPINVANAANTTRKF